MKIMEKFKLCILISVVIILAGLASVFISGGLNLGIDFTGGSIITFDIGSEFDTLVIEKAFADTGISTTPIQKSAISGSQEQTLAEARIKSTAAVDDDSELRDTVLAKVQEKYAEADIVSVEKVGAVSGIELALNTLMCVGIAVVLMLIYIAIRFELSAGIAAILALIHDVLILFSIICLIRMEINTSFIAAVLTVIGYSIYNTIVVFDRVRGNMAQNIRQDMATSMNACIGEIFTRSMYTALAALVISGSLYVFGTGSIRDFALPIIVGVLAGTYSSLVLSGPIWAMLNNKLQKNKVKGKAAKA